MCTVARSHSLPSILRMWPPRRARTTAPEMKQGHFKIEEGRVPHLALSHLSHVLQNPYIRWRTRFVLHPLVILAPTIFFLQVGLTRLCDIAFKGIQSQLDENNILEELFSPFTAESVISKPTIADCANEIPHASHERVREMEHELFQSKLKPLVDGAPLYDIIESSSLGEHPHRAAVMELILERSVRRCRKGTLSEAKDTPRPDSAPQPKRGSLVLNTPAQQVRPVSKAHSRTGMQSLRWQISQLRVRRSPLCLLFQLHHEVRWLRKYQVSMRQPLHQLSRKVPVQVIFMSRQRSSPTRSVVPIAGTSNQ